MKNYRSTEERKNENRRRERTTKSKRKMGQRWNKKLKK